MLRAMWDASSEETAYTPYPGAVFEETFLRQFLVLVAEVVLFVLTRPRSHRILETAFRPVTETSWG